MAVDFNKILDEWEDNEKNRGEKQASHPLSSWLDNNEIINKDLEQSRKNRQKPKVHKNMKPQAEIDLHGLTIREAEAQLDAFFLECNRKKLKKILIIHGKGIHSTGEPILKKYVRTYLEKSPFAGDSGVAAREYGGSGALWVFLKKPNVPGR